MVPQEHMLLLVYEFMPNCSLDQHIFITDDDPILSWDRRYNIIAGLASALHYLHDEYDQKVVHRDLKASNVMLDASFNARLGDFGLARAIDTDKTSYADVELDGVPGTVGYIAPECFLTGKATRQSDVFGFGAVMLEVACGRRPRCEVAGFKFLLDWVWRLYREGRILDAMDEKLAGNYEAAEAERLLMLALACSHPIPGERPKTQAIVQILSGTVPVPKVPPFKPAFVWPSGPVEEEEDHSSATTRLTSSGVNSSFYASSGGWTPQTLSREVFAGRRV